MLTQERKIHARVISKIYLLSLSTTHVANPKDNFPKSFDPTRLEQQAVELSAS